MLVGNDRAERFYRADGWWPDGHRRQEDVFGAPVDEVRYRCALSPQLGAEGIVERVRVALESADLDAIGELLDPDVRWGAPDDPEPSCQNREQVLAWYRRGRQAGVRAQVTETAVHGDKILVGLRVTGRPEADDAGVEPNRWQVLTVGHRGIFEICGFDERGDAAERAGGPTESG